MSKYWWVNHNQTFMQERGQGYLWSPKREAHGARSQFYENMAAPARSANALLIVESLRWHIGLEHRTKIANIYTHFHGGGDGQQVNHPGITVQIRVRLDAWHPAGQNVVIVRDQDAFEPP
nr:hypothetical protein [Hydrogenophaga sp.]